ncbi:MULTISPECIES: hypothetical protein [Salinibaculum]|uniref:hypothetical protein n=1 Tax=Salinibaculum TaxID=2732368 RepID=UPI0030CED8E0
MALEIIEAVVEAATGPVGLVVIFVYSVLVAFVLPLPGELVLLPAPQLALGLPPAAGIALVVVVSAVGKAIGSVWALRIGRSAVQARPSRWLLRRVVPGYERRGTGPLGRFVRRYEYVGLAAVLAVPLMPDTAVVYAFSALDADERRFAVAAFVGTVARLLITLALAAGVLATL